MARETADAFAVAARNGAEHERGLGKALGEFIGVSKCSHASASLVYAAHKAGIPCTIHVALGTDIVHMHPHVSGAALGEASLLDFRILCRVIHGMEEGLWLNIGSAVVMPEVFLKAIAVARNFGANLDGLITANLDKEAKYRTKMNVLSRPGAAGIEIIGHHELLIPLLHAAVAAKIASREIKPLAALRINNLWGRHTFLPRGVAHNNVGPTANWRRTAMSTELIDLVQRLGEPNVVVIGDVMLDRYVWGDAERISQEAPVILLRADRREERLGGASSVATMLRALGARVSLLGVVGDDPDAARVRAILHSLQIDAEGVITEAGRPTTVKERYIGRAQHRHPQQMLRVDFETRQPLHGSIEQELIATAVRKIGAADIILVSDYDKGVCTPEVMARTIATAKAHGRKVLADPIRGTDYRKYRGCSAITPNRLEAGLATGRTIQSNEEALQAGRELAAMLDLDAGIVTLDKDGMALCRRNGRAEIFPTRPRQVYDITGAGDMVMSVLGLALAGGADWAAAIRLANIAGGLEVEKIGVATVTREEIIHDLLYAPTLEATAPQAAKIKSLPQLVAELQVRRQSGQKIAFTNGCFDVLHAGHVQYLSEARAQADALVVAINSDSSVRSLKGSGRPVNPVEARTAVLAGLQSVELRDHLLRINADQDHRSGAAGRPGQGR